jgi:hypothetical protein
MAGAHRIAVLSDGARRNWEAARVNFPSTRQILDFYHGTKHVGALAAALGGKDTPRCV